MTPTEKRPGKTRPWAASPATRPVRERPSAEATTTSASAAAPRTSSGEPIGQTMAASTTPGKAACPMASTSIDWREVTRKAPGRAHATAVTAMRASTPAA